jgi:imidazolonepropionase-like amidohydrolase
MSILVKSVRVAAMMGMLGLGGSAQIGFAQPAPTRGTTIVLRASRMLDVKTGTIVRNPAVVVTNRRITAAGVDASIPAGATVIDLGDAMLLPGLIDAHTHLLQNYEGRFGSDDPNMALTVAAMGTTRRALLGAKLGARGSRGGNHVRPRSGQLGARR